MLLLTTVPIVTVPSIYAENPVAETRTKSPISKAPVYGTVQPMVPVPTVTEVEETTDE